MTQEPKKPEWFEIAESDNAAAAVTKVDKKLTVLAAIVAGGIIAAGAFFANASGSPTANAENVSKVAAIVSASPSTTATNAPSANPTTSITNPSQGGIPEPQGRGDEDGDREFGDRPDHDGDHEGREHHERGEHHEDRDHDDD